VSVGETIGLVEREERILRTWKKKAKGKPMRWRILRDIVACLSLASMTSSEIQISMRRLYALKNKTTRDMLEELEEEQAVVQWKKDESGPFRWRATPGGAEFWVESATFIPASIARVVETTLSVSASEV